MYHAIEELSKANQNVIRSFTGGLPNNNRTPIDHQKLVKLGRLDKYMSEGNYSVNDVYKQIQNKTCQLSSELRKFFLTEYREFKGE